MRIGVDSTCWANERGYGRYARQIVSAMVALSPQDEFICFLDGPSNERFDLDAPNVQRMVVKTSAGAVAAASANGSRSLADMLSMTRAVSRNRPDVFYSPSVYTYFPLPAGLRSVITIHDAIADRFPHLTVPSWRARIFWNAKVWLALRQSRSVLTVSDYAAGEVSRAHGVRLSEIGVTLEAPAAEFAPRSAGMSAAVAARHGLEPRSNWFIYVGGFNPHKNVRSIVSAHAELGRVHGDNAPLLLLVGDAEGDTFHSEVDAIRGSIEAAGSGSRVRWLGFVPDDDLSALLSASIALVIPSESEGFGLPAIEAAACGAPVIATLESPLPQLLEGCGLFVPPGDTSAISAAMRRFVTDESFRKACGNNGLLRAKQLTWERSAAVCLDAIRKAAA
ncbi:MAG TPA: glycosyltransferase family 1 protein [Gemmatimonadaceae bacterium]|nr:glycosyltransferase family 1 protein [Gemmatimonadaceae bacterium]